jgi:hypothetical protein
MAQRERRIDPGPANGATQLMQGKIEEGISIEEHEHLVEAMLGLEQRAASAGRLLFHVHADFEARAQPGFEVVRKVLDTVGQVACEKKEPADAGPGKLADQCFEKRYSTDLEEGLWRIRGELSKARAQAPTADDSLFY